MSVPSVIERLLGSAASSLRFEEKQWFRYDPASGMACVRSEPRLVSPKSDSFKTEVTVYLAAFGDDRSRQGLANIARHFNAYRSTEETRVQSALNDVASNICHALARGAPCVPS